MKKILNLLYRIFLMPYIETDKYYEELLDDVYENDIPRITNEILNSKQKYIK